jgi:23S rRNA (guanosine2251-2'-O)-methyltransferase
VIPPTPPGCFFLTGNHALHAALTHGLTGLVRCFVDRTKIEPALEARLKQLPPGIQVTPVPPTREQEFLHQGVGCWLREPQWPDLTTFLTGTPPASTKRCIVVLDQIEDPNNFGQIIRTCEVAGVSALVVAERRSVSLTQAAAQVSQGAFLRLPILSVVNIVNALQELKENGIWVYGFEWDEKAIAWHRAPFGDRETALVFGSEGRGIRPLVKKNCDQLVALPQRGVTHSLNVSAAVAAGVFEVVRQQLSS